MAELTYTAVTWTAGDIITEAKMDNMVANDQAVDSHNQGSRFTERADPLTPPANTLHLYAKDNNGVSSLFFIDDSGSITQLGDVTPTFIFPVPGSLIVGTSLTAALIVPKPLTIKKAYAYVKTAPVGASIITNILKNNASIWNATPANKLSIADGVQSGSETSFDVTALSEGDILTLNVDQVGGTTAGSDLTVALKTQ